MSTRTQYIGEKPGSRGSEVSADGSRRYHVTYRVLAMSASIGDDRILATRGLPQIGNRHLFHPYAFVNSVAARRVPDSGEAWEVDVTWEATPGQRQDEKTKPPWERPPRIRFDEVLVQDSRRKDLNGEPFVNTAGDPLDPAVTIPRSDTMITVERAELEYDEIDAMQWGNQTNSDMWRGYPLRAALMHMPTASDDYYTTPDNSEQYWNVVYRIWVKASAFDVEDPQFWIPMHVLNQGPRCMHKVWANNKATWRREFCEDDNGVASTESFLLNRDGSQMTREDVETWGPQWLDFHVHGERPFGTLFPGA